MNHPSKKTAATLPLVRCAVYTRKSTEEGLEGTTCVVKAGPVFELLGKNALDEVALATPALADGRLFLRTVTTLYCIENASRQKLREPPARQGG